MDIRTYRARSVPEALEMVRRELGPDATVMHTRQIHDGLWGRLLGNRGYEVAAAPPKESPPLEAAPRGDAAPRGGESAPSQPATSHQASESLPQDGTTYEADSEATRAACERDASPELADRHLDDDQEVAMPEGLFQAYVDLVDADADEAVARRLVQQLRQDDELDAHSPLAVRQRLVRLLETNMPVAGPLRTHRGRARRVALVGPTGVGKTTTLAKLAANYRLRDNRRVGLITVDTYRIAAVEQLRTYADIIDLPMEVVSTPREMRQAVERMRDFDLVLMDTAGRSPRDEVKIRELRAMLQEAEPDEVHLVLSAVSSARSLVAAVERFAPAGVTALLITKLDEAIGLGHLLALWDEGGLPVSYLTDGQNVPDDICVAEARMLAEAILATPPPLAESPTHAQAELAS